MADGRRTVAMSMMTVMGTSALATSPPLLRLPTFVASHMALQRAPISARLWGWAAPGSNVSAVLDGATAAITTAAAPAGNWSIDLPPQPAGAGRTIVISSGRETATLHDVAFGDVFLCSGQSNMQFALNNAFNASAEIAASAYYSDIRLATVKMVTSNAPKDDAPTKANYTWFFGRDVYDALGRAVPIGLVASDWGGQRVEAFSSPDALSDRTCGGTRPASRASSALSGRVVVEEEAAAEATAAAATEVEAEEEAAPSTADRAEAAAAVPWEAVPNPAPTQLWNAMIHPLLPMRFFGAVWYQGEANWADPSGYACRFPAMIADWRAKFGLPELTFLYVQLAGYARHDWARIRAAQGAALRLPKVGAAIALDLSDPTSPWQSIHPRRKQEVGRRLALAARAIAYGEARKGLVHAGPTPSGAVQLTPTGAVVGFREETAARLHLHGAAACTACCAVSPFETMDARGKWARATALVRGSAVVLTAASPVLGVRLGWEGRPECALYNGVGGPDDHTGLAAAPFQWCAFGTVGHAPPWEASCAAHDPRKVYYPAARVASAAAGDFSFGGGAGLAGVGRRDATCSGVNLRSGNPGGVGTLTSTHAIVTAAGAHSLAGVALSFRYIAGYTPAPPAHKHAPTVAVLLTDGAGGVLRTLLASTPPLGNYSYDVFSGFSPPVHVHARGLNLSGVDAYLELRVTNHERNLQIPLDDLALGWNVTLEWSE